MVSVLCKRPAAKLRYSEHAYDPWELQSPMMEQPGIPIPPEPEILQWPSTASSGRRLMVTSLGGSYVFLSPICSVF